MLVVVLGTQCTLHFGKSAIIDLFTNDPSVKELAMSTFWVMAVVTFFDTIQGVAQGVIRALALQKLASYIALAAYYIFTIPLAFILCFAGSMNVAGLWVGIGVGCVIQAYFYIHLCTFTAEWDQIADEAFKRIKAEGQNSFENSFHSYHSIEKQKTFKDEEELLDGNTPEKTEIKVSV